MNSNEKAISVYLHWPFCVSKCPYCDFSSVASSDSNLYDEFGQYLLEDLKRTIKKFDVHRIDSVFFGGGTPSLIPGRAISNILDFLRNNYIVNEKAEITLEANPGTFDLQKAKEFHNAGINRLSLGIQSFSDKNLRFLERCYDSKQACIATEIASKTFSNFSVDLMYGLDFQDIDSLDFDLNKSLDFGCKHFSCYQLTYEEHTPFYDRVMSGDIKQLSEEQELCFYQYIHDFLQKHCIFRYEVSNYALSGYESVHNLSYWRYNDYLGVGASAHSRMTINGRKNEIIKISNPYRWKDDLDNNIDTFRELTAEEELKEIIIVGLRITDGIEYSNIYNRIQKKIVDKILSYKKISLLREYGLIEKDENKIQLTDAGFIKMNSVIEFLFDV